MHAASCTLLVLSTCLFLVLLPASASAADSSTAVDEAALDRAMDSYWQAKGVKQRQRAARQILQLEPSFAQVYRRLQAGRVYCSKVSTGRQAESIGIHGLWRHYAFHVPESYDPARAYPVRFYLHGGANRPQPRRTARWYPEDWVIRDDTISVFPAGWEESLWWNYSQVESIAGILDRLKREYNIDENRVSLTGFSDGGSGTFFQAFLNTTPWAAFVPLCGAGSVLSNPRTGADGVMYVANLTNKPMLIVNTGHDRYYPLHQLLPFFDLYRRAGVRFELVVRPFRGHDLTWYRQEEQRIEEFYAAYHRDPYPDRLTWQADDLQRFGRAHWLLITRLGAVPGEARLDSWNVLLMEPVVPALGLVFDPDVPGRLQVRRVVEEYPAAAAGIEPGDVILQVGDDEKPVTGWQQLHEAAQRYSCGASFPLRLRRGATQLQVEITYPAWPQQPPYRQAYHRKGRSGRVELTRTGNRIDALTNGVEQFTLLISPAEFDLAQPVEVFTNGVLAFSAPVQAGPAVLLRWAARDHDRTMLFAAEVEVTVRGTPAAGE